jgi:hypothetical protein
MRQSMKQVEAERMKAVDDTRTVPLFADVPSRTVMICTEVSKKEEDKLLQFLRHNQDVFARSKSDLTGVHRSVIEHALNTDPKFKPKLQMSCRLPAYSCKEGTRRTPTRIPL